jgi:organic hydroperoxide reductase OsmC/OhrA
MTDLTERTHGYSTRVVWTGDRGSGTRSYRAYARDHEIRGDGKGTILGSSDPAFRGDASRWNPEELLVASLSACHMLWFLHLCAESGIVVTAYEDDASGTMAEEKDGGGRFTGVVLRPRVATASSASHHAIEALHERAHAMCFIARSVSFAVRCEPRAS